MKRRTTFNLLENTEFINWDSTCTLHTIVHRESSVIDEFYFEKITNPDGSESVSIVDPVYVLFNQQRLERLGSAGIQHFLNQLQSHSDSLAELRKQCSDENLMTLMKSRYLQSPSEILAWCRYMESNIDQFNAEVAALVKEKTSEVADKKTESTTLNTE